MQRSIINQETIKLLILLMLFLVYESMTSIYYYLPPFFGAAFVLFIDIADRNNKYLLAPIIAFLIFFEADKGYLFLSSVVFFYVSYRFVVPGIKNIIGCQKCLVPIFISYTYFGYHLFIQIVSVMFELPVNDFSLIMLYYVFVESLLILALL